MATPRQLRQLKAALAYDDADVRDLTLTFLEHKIAVYIDTLGDLADQYGYDLPDDTIVLSDDVLRALRDEARVHAQSVVATFNDDLGKLIDRNATLGRDELLSLYEQWAEQRAETKAETIAITEAYSAHADAIAGFFAAAGIEPDFDFGGHGDDAPVCEVCQALLATSPHPLSRVVEVGVPHIGCRQDWHERDIDPDALPDVIELGAAPGGIVGQDALVNRAGNDHQAAAAMIQELAANADT